MKTENKDMNVNTILLAVLSILLTVVGVFLKNDFETFQATSITVIRQSEILNSMSKDVEEIKTKLENVPTREEVDRKLKALRGGISSDGYHQYEYDQTNRAPHWKDIEGQN